MPKKQLSPVEAIRKRCLDCKEVAPEIRECEFDPKHKEACALWQFRMKKAKRGLSRLKAIRKYCLWCVNGLPEEVRLCPTKDCVLYKYRFGKNPNLVGKRVNNLNDKNRYRKPSSSKQG